MSFHISVNERLKQFPDSWLIAFAIQEGLKAFTRSATHFGENVYVRFQRNRNACMSESLAYDLDIDARLQ